MKFLCSIVSLAALATTTPLVAAADRDVNTDEKQQSGLRLVSQQNLPINQNERDLMSAGEYIWEEMESSGKKRRRREEEKMTVVATRAVAKDPRAEAKEDQVVATVVREVREVREAREAPMMEEDAKKSATAMIATTTITMFALNVAPPVKS